MSDLRTGHRPGASENRRISLEFAPHAALVSSARRFLEELYSRWLVNPNDTYRLAMTAHELLENLVKYSSGRTSLVEIDVRHDGASSVVSIRTKNRAEPEQLEELRRAIERLSQASDPVAIYDELVRTSSSRQGSGLGLARIRAEADMSLEYSVDDGEVTIVAESSMPVRAETPCLS